MFAHLGLHLLGVQQGNSLSLGSSLGGLGTSLSGGLLALGSSTCLGGKLGQHRLGLLASGGLLAKSLSLGLGHGLLHCGLLGSSGGWLLSSTSSGSGLLSGGSSSLLGSSSRWFSCSWCLLLGSSRRRSRGLLGLWLLIAGLCCKSKSIITKINTLVNRAAKKLG